MKLILRVPNWVGDAVMALPAVDCAREATGADYVAIAARSATVALFRNHPDIDRVITLHDTQNRLRGAREAIAEIRKESFDIGVIFPPSFSSAMMFKLAGITGRIGYASDLRSMLLTRAVKAPPEKTHRIRQYLRLMETVTGIKAPDKAPGLYLSHEDIARGEKILSIHSLSYDDPFVVISPQAVAESRRWGTDNYGRLAERIAEDMDVRVLLLGARHDREAGEQVKACCPDRIVNLCGETGLIEAAAIASFARLFVGNDSGLAHLAGSVGCPIVVLSGPDNPDETSPRSAKKKVIIKDIDCISCVKNVCPKKGDDFMKCMRLITVDEVYDAAREIAKT